MCQNCSSEIEDKEILSDSQLGFRKGLSTSHALTVLGDHVTRALNRRHITIGVSLDFSRAFDKVWHKFKSLLM